MKTLRWQELTVEGRRFGLVADTHCPRLPFPEWLLPEFQGVDLILHAGDVVDAGVVARLRALAPVVVAAGNNDPPGAWPDVVRITLQGARLLLTHGHLGRGRSAAERVAGLAWGAADVAVFGHTHVPFEATLGNLVLLNPGSAGDPRQTGGVGAAILDLGEKALRVRFLLGPRRGGGGLGR
jgi:putative phosphoesterase